MQEVSESCLRNIFESDIHFIHQIFNKIFPSPTVKYILPEFNG